MALDVILASPSDLPTLLRFFRAVAAAESAGDPAAAESAADRGEAGLRAALATHDFLGRADAPLLLACAGGEPVGYLQAVVIPKADARAGFLFVDEIYVLPAYRRRGAARALLQRVQSLAVGQGLAGVRLLVRGENAAARGLYRACGFGEQETVFCQWRLP